MSIFTGVAMGIYPALQSARDDLVEGSERRRARDERQRASTAVPQNFVGAQVALSVTLLAGAALLITSFVRLNRQNIGFHSENRLGRFCYLAAGAISGSRTRATFRAANAGGIARRSRVRKRYHQRGYSAPGRRRQQYTLYAARGEILPIDNAPPQPVHDIAPGLFQDLGHSDSGRTRFR